MSHSRKDACGGHRSHNYCTTNWGMAWSSMTGKRFAKHFRSKQARRNSRDSIRHLSWEDMHDEEEQTNLWDDDFVEQYYEDLDSQHEYELFGEDDDWLPEPEEHCQFDDFEPWYYDYDGGM